MTEQQYWSQLTPFLIATVVLILYLAFRTLYSGINFLISGQSDELELLEKGEIELSQMQSGPWQHNNPYLLTGGRLEQCTDR